MGRLPQGGGNLRPLDEGVHQVIYSASMSNDGPRPQQFHGTFHQPKDPSKPAVHMADVLDHVAEEHVYVEFKTPSGKDILMEVDLVGDRVVQESQGAIPPQIHIRCPMCSTASVPIDMSITPPNKTVELEPLPQDRWRYYVATSSGQVERIKAKDVRAAAGQGHRVCVSKEALTIVEPFACKDCGTLYALHDTGTETVLELAR